MALGGQVRQEGRMGMLSLLAGAGTEAALRARELRPAGARLEPQAPPASASLAEPCLGQVLIRGREGGSSHRPPRVMVWPHSERKNFLSAGQVGWVLHCSR